MRSWLYAVAVLAILAVMAGPVFAGTDTADIPVGGESVEELEETEESVMESPGPVTDPEEGLGEEIIDEETVDTDS